MKKIITAASLAALGTLSLSAAYAPDLSSAEKSKFWSISATLRGFYDDNWNTRPSHPTTVGAIAAQDSLGINFSPKGSLYFNLAEGTTLITADYGYDLRYYFDRVTHEADQAHMGNVKLDHAFSENYKIVVKDSVAYSQEPEVLNPEVGPQVMILRSDRNVLRNTADVTFNAQFSERFGAMVSYANTLWAYDDPTLFYLDRDEHKPTAEFLYNIQKKTDLLVGYSFQADTRDNDDDLMRTPSAVLFRPWAAIPLPADYMESYSHFFYAGVKHKFTALLVGQLRAGAQYTEFSNLTAPMLAYGRALGFKDFNDSSTIPYVDARLTYQFTKGGYVTAAVTHQRSAGTDLGALDLESTSAMLAVSYKITPKFVATAMGSVQFSDVYGSFTTTFDKENFYTCGLNLAYLFTQNFSAEVGYNLDRLDTDWADRAYTRNRVYWGVRASY